MNNETVQRLKDLVTQNASIGILVGKNPTIDQMGAALGLFLTLRNMGKNVNVASPTHPIVEISSLVGIDKVKKSLEGAEGGDLVVSFPYKEGEIEKVSYTLEGGYLNIIVKAGEAGLSFNQQDVEYRQGGGSVPGLLFIVGTSRLADLGNIFSPDIFKDTTVVNIDNRQDNQGYGDVVLVSNRFSSVSEQVAHMIITLGYSVDQDAAQNLLSGISSATGNFQKPSTSPIAFEMAASLMKKGAVREQRGGRPHSQSEEMSYFPAPNAQQAPRQQGFADRGQKGVQRAGFQQSVQQRQHGNQPRQQFTPPTQNQSFQPPIASAPLEPVSSQGRQFQQPSPQPQQPQRQQFEASNMSGASDTRDEGAKEPPADWLTPKIYKGSTNI